MLSWGFATKDVCVCVCVRAGASCCESRYEKKRVKGCWKTERALKRATVLQAREPTVDLAALESEKCCFEKRYGITTGLRVSRRKLRQLPRLRSPLIPMPSAPPQRSGLGKAGWSKRGGGGIGDIRRFVWEEYVDGRIFSQFWISQWIYHLSYWSQGLPFALPQIENEKMDHLMYFSCSFCF